MVCDNVVTVCLRIIIEDLLNWKKCYETESLKIHVSALKQFALTESTVKVLVTVYTAV